MLSTVEAQPNTETLDFNSALTTLRNPKEKKIYFGKF